MPSLGHFFFKEYCQYQLKGSQWSSKSRKWRIWHKIALLKPEGLTRKSLSHSEVLRIKQCTITCKRQLVNGHWCDLFHASPWLCLTKTDGGLNALSSGHSSWDCSLSSLRFGFKICLRHGNSIFLKEKQGLLSLYVIFFLNCKFIIWKVFKGIQIKWHLIC